MKDSLSGSCGLFTCVCFESLETQIFTVGKSNRSHNLTTDAQWKITAMKQFYALVSWFKIWRQDCNHAQRTDSHSGNKVV